MIGKSSGSGVSESKELKSASSLDILAHYRIPISFESDGKSHCMVGLDGSGRALVSTVTECVRNERKDLYNSEQVEKW
jgi:hypothetical protein